MTNRACCLDTLSKSYGVPWSKKEIGGNCGIPGIFIVECYYIYIYMSQSLMKTSSTRKSQEKTATVLATTLRSQRSEAIILQLQD